jgi:hypothetical protein
MNDTGRDKDAGGRIRIPVHEDFLFDVDVERRELSPVYCKSPWKQLFPTSDYLSHGFKDGFLLLRYISRSNLNAYNLCCNSS